MTCITSNTDVFVQQNCLSYANSQTQNYYNALFENFYSSGTGLWIPGINDISQTDDNLRFQNLLADLCNTGSNGKYCRNPLFQICSEYTREDMSHPIIRKMCGCYLPDSEYPGGIRACDSICSGYDTIKYHENGSNSAQSCISSVCIIDNITLIAKGSSVGDITFIQSCPYCSAGSDCRCIIGDINIIAQDSRLGALNLEQNCSGTLECYSDIDGVRVPVENCQDYIESFGLNTSVVMAQKTTYTIYAWAFLGFTICLLILFIVGTLLAFAYSRQAKIIKVTKIIDDLPEEFRADQP